jgi:putative transposase
MKRKRYSNEQIAFALRRTAMPRKNYKPEEIVAKLRQVDVLTSQGRSVAEAIRSIGVSEVTYYLYGRLSRCKTGLSGLL